MSSIHAFITKENASHTVVIYSKSYCSYCRQTKETFKAINGLDVQIYELDKIKDGDKIQSELLKITGQSTVPNVFIKDKHIGGNDNVQILKANGKLHEILQQ